MLFASIVKFELPEFDIDQSIGFELRLDLFPCINLVLVQRFIQSSTHPVMLTLRSLSHGGKFQGTELERESFIEQLLRLEPDFFDLEYDMSPEFLKRVLKNYPKTKFVLSYHNFQETPLNLDEIYHLKVQYEAFTYKIATMTLSVNDALKMLNFSKKRPKVSAICMGDKGVFARVLSPVVGNLVNYASLERDSQTAPGQLTVSELVELYNYPMLNSKTAIYGLIGDPVTNSPGHLYHNSIFNKKTLNAVYVKMEVKLEELAEFIPLAKKLDIRGLSVTIPLKEVIVPFVDEINDSIKPIGAINTLLFKKGKILATNTDGVGALNAIEKKTLVFGKKVVLIGAGGAARSIAFEACSRGADVWVLNRTLKKAQEVAVSIGCRSGGLKDVPLDYDILINCSPDPMPINPDKIRDKTIAMDIVYFPRKTTFLKEAELRDCRIVYGEEMFFNQAEGQTSFWIQS